MSHASEYNQLKFANLVKRYREGIGEVSELNGTVQALHDRIDELESQNVELIRQLKQMAARMDKASEVIQQMKAGK